MAAPPEPPNGINFFLPWGLLEWAIGVLAAAAGSIALWVWNLGVKTDITEAKFNGLIDKAKDERIRLEKEQIRLEGRLDKMEVTIQEARHSIQELRNYIGEQFRDLPSRSFVESQITQLSERMDGMIDAKMIYRRASHRGDGSAD